MRKLVSLCVAVLGASALAACACCPPPCPPPCAPPYPPPCGCGGPYGGPYGGYAYGPGAPMPPPPGYPAYGYGPGASAGGAQPSGGPGQPTQPYAPPPGAAAPGAAGPQSGGAPASAPDAGDVVTIQNRSYQPATLTVRAGSTVRWVNRDPMPHSASGNGFDVEIPPGGEASHTFATPGTYDVRCRYHPDMHGQIVVE